MSGGYRDPRLLGGLRWKGGKNANSSVGTGRWVASLLPADVGLYVEPFAGMLGVLLQRAPVLSEIVSDADYEIMNWWQVVRDYPDWLGQKVDATPNKSQAHLEAALAYLDGWEPTFEEPGQLVGDRWAAYHFNVRCAMSAHGSGTLDLNYGTTTSMRHFPAASRIRRLAARLMRTHLVTGDALKLIDRVAAVSDCLVYADPPYPSSPGYYQATVDYEALVAGLLACEGRAALSGQVADTPYYDRLESEGWVRSEFPTTRSAGWQGYDTDSGQAQRKDAGECLWTNYEPIRGSFDDLWRTEEEE